MSRTRVRRRRLAVTLAVTMVIVAGIQALAGAAGAGPASPDRGTAEDRYYVVRPGDTLWRIAERFAGPGVDPRPLVHGIVDANAVDPGTLVAGQALTIPAG